MSLGEEGIIHEQNYKEEKRKAEDVTEFLLKYISLLNGNFQDFFTQNMWEEIPWKWRATLQSIKEEQLYHMLMDLDFEFQSIPISGEDIEGVNNTTFEEFLEKIRIYKIDRSSIFGWGMLEKKKSTKGKTKNYYLKTSPNLSNESILNNTRNDDNNVDNDNLKCKVEVNNEVSQLQDQNTANEIISNENDYKYDQKEEEQNIFNEFSAIIDEDDNFTKSSTKNKQNKNKINKQKKKIKGLSTNLNHHHHQSALKQPQKFELETNNVNTSSSDELQTIRDDRPLKQQFVDTFEGVPQIICAGMNTKKIHEVSLLCPLINSVINIHKSILGRDIILMDIGAGMAYIGKILAWKYNQKVLCIDNKTSDSLSRNLQSVSSKLCSFATKSISKKGKLLNELIKVEHCDLRLHFTSFNITPLLLSAFPNHLQPHSLQQQQQQQQQMNANGGLDGTVMIGLHTCGDLAVTTIKLMIESNCEAMINISCCYHLLSSFTKFNAAVMSLPFSQRCFPSHLTPHYLYDDDTKMKGEESFVGFPLSDVLKKCGGDKLGENRIFGLATSYMPSSPSTASTKYVNHAATLKVNFFRALLQVLLREHYGITQPYIVVGSSMKIAKKRKSNNNNGDICDDSLGDGGDEITIEEIDSSAIGEEAQWITYSLNALTKLKLVHPSTELLRELYRNYLIRRRELNAWWCLRSLFSSILEWLIYQDRLLYLYEHAIYGVFFPLFSPSLSPRNLILIATKSHPAYRAIIYQLIN